MTYGLICQKLIKLENENADDQIGKSSGGGCTVFAPGAAGMPTGSVRYPCVFRIFSVLGAAVMGVARCRHYFLLEMLVATGAVYFG